MTPDEIRQLVREEVRAEHRRIAEESLLMMQMSDAAGTSEFTATRMLLNELVPAFNRDTLDGP